MAAGYTQTGFDADTQEFSDSDFAVTRYDAAGVLDGSFGPGTGRVTTDFGGKDFGHAMTIQSDGKIVVVGRVDSAGADDWGIAGTTLTERLTPPSPATGRPHSTWGEATPPTGWSPSPTERSSSSVSPINRVRAMGDCPVQREWIPSTPPSLRTGSTRSTSAGGMGRSMSLSRAMASPWSAAMQTMPLVSPGTTRTAPWTRPSQVMESRQRSSVDQTRQTAARSNRMGRSLPPATTSTTAPSPSPATRRQARLTRPSPRTARRRPLTGTRMDRMPSAFNPMGKIVAVGDSNDSFALDGDFLAARFNPNGTLDTGFSSDGLQSTDFGPGFGGRVINSAAYAVTIQPDGKIISVGGTDNSPGGQDDFALARYNADGSADGGFTGGGQGYHRLLYRPAVCGGVELSGPAVRREGRSGGRHRRRPSLRSIFMGARPLRPERDSGPQLWRNR